MANNIDFGASLQGSQARYSAGLFARRAKELAGLVGVVAAGLSMSIAPNLPEAGLAREAVVLFGVGGVAFGVRALQRTRRLSKIERELLLSRVSETPQTWHERPTSDEASTQKVTSLAKTLEVSKPVRLPTPMWRPEHKTACVEHCECGIAFPN